MLVPVILSGRRRHAAVAAVARAASQATAAARRQQHHAAGDRRRLGGHRGAPRPIVVCNEAHRFTGGRTDLRSIDCTPRAILLEPVGRNTAPAVALAAHAALARPIRGDRCCWWLPADHVVRDAAPLSHAAIEWRRGLAQTASW